MSKFNQKLNSSNLFRITLASIVLTMATVSRAQSQLHYWPADESAQDVAGDADGTLVNLAYYGQGYLGRSFHFNDGSQGVTNASVDLGASADFGTSDFIISFAMKTVQPGLAALLAKRAVCSHASFWSIRLQDGGLSIEVDDGHGNYTQFFSTRKDLADGKWHNVVLVRTGVTTTLFLDGEADSSAVAPAGVPVNVSNQASLVVGYDVCTYADPTVPFVGSLDEIMICAK